MSNNVPNRVDDELETMLEVGRTLLRGRASNHVYEHLFETSGKLIRPRLLFLCTAYGEEMGGRPRWSDARLAGLAMHLGHSGSLYHDDIVDRSPIRRGMPAHHREFGVRVSSLAGAHLMAVCNELMGRLSAPLSRKWAVTAQRMADGQLRDSENAGSLSLTTEKVLDVASRKTGAAFELSAFLGARIGCASHSEIRTLTQLGRHIGLAFQLANDLDDFTNDAASHRPAANDLRERLYTLPVVLGYQRNDHFGTRLREVLAEDGRTLSNGAVDEVRQLLDDCGALKSARAIAAAARDSALTAVLALRRGHVRDSLVEFVSDFAPRPAAARPSAHAEAQP